MWGQHSFFKWGKASLVVVFVFAACANISLRIYNAYHFIPIVVYAPQVVGIWSVSPHSSPLWDERYQFFPDQKYNHRISQTQCGKGMYGESGSWTVSKDGTLILAPIKPYGQNEGESIHECKKGDLLLRSEPVDQALLRLNRPDVQKCRDSVSSILHCLSIDHIQFYQLDSDPYLKGDKLLDGEPYFD